MNPYENGATDTEGYVEDLLPYIAWPVGIVGLLTLALLLAAEVL